MLKKYRRKLKSYVPRSIKDYLFSIRQIPKRFENHKLICEHLRNKQILEVGGPSTMFYTKIPFYQNLKSLDVVNFSSNTIWEGNIKEGYTCNYYGNKKAYQHISEASLLENISDDSYDAVVSSHCLEHVANPIKALLRWKKVIKSKGYMLIVLPNKIGNFDHKREDTTFEHLISDFENNIDENDTTHFDEFIEFFDLNKAPGKKIDLDEHIERTKNNYIIREVHHHVFSKKLIFKLLQHCDFEIMDYLEKKEDLITFCKKKN